MNTQPSRTALPGSPSRNSSDASSERSRSTGRCRKSERSKCTGIPIHSASKIVPHRATCGVPPATCVARGKRAERMCRIVTSSRGIVVVSWPASGGTLTISWAVRSASSRLVIVVSITCERDVTLMSGVIEQGGRSAQWEATSLTTCVADETQCSRLIRLIATLFRTRSTMRTGDNKICSVKDSEVRSGPHTASWTRQIIPPGIESTIATQPTPTSRGPAGSFGTSGLLMFGGGIMVDSICVSRGSCKPS
mmetsp:Transcript_8539/g.20193  ORF Transcript_8539/g.20193 Transcript_8539/m.20193 type:complete len:250 (+) Transcript_8539:320-1069(+)